jgi:hypothetical protein
MKQITFNVDFDIKVNAWNGEKKFSDIVKEEYDHSASFEEEEKLRPLANKAESGGKAVLDENEFKLLASIFRKTEGTTKRAFSESLSSLNPNFSVSQYEKEHLN